MVRTRLEDQGAASIAKLSKMQDLNIEHSEVSDAGMARLAALTELRRLNLDNTQVTDDSAAAIVNLKKLTWLNLYHTLFTKQGYETVKAALPECEIVFDEKSRRINRRRS
jgi:hypothetical protein